LKACTGTPGQLDALTASEEVATLGRGRGKKRARGQRMRPLGSITRCLGSSPMVSAPSAELSASDTRLDSGPVVTLHVITIVPS